MQLLRSLLLVFGLKHVKPHMQMVEPAPRESQYNKIYNGTVDYDILAPLSEAKPFPCRGAPAGPVVQTAKGGSSIHVKIQGGASHNGGHCQFALSFDGKSFVVLKTVMNNCLTESGLEFDIPLPDTVPSSQNAVFAWTWINKTGNREYYMNCADIKVEGQQNGILKGPELLVANLPGYPTVPEFTNSEDLVGNKLFNERKITPISPNQSSQEYNQDKVPKTDNSNNHEEGSKNNTTINDSGDSKVYDQSVDDIKRNIDTLSITPEHKQKCKSKNQTY